MNKRIYLDNNATAPIDPRVALALTEAMQEPLGNPSSPHYFGQRAKGILSEARQNIAQFFRAKQSQIIFTSGGSEGAKLAILGLLKDPKNAHILSSNIEHACVFETLEALKQEGAEVEFLEAKERGAVDPLELESAIRPTTKMIVLMAVNNETGVKCDLEAVSAIAEKHRIPLVVDGVAWLGKELFTIPSGVSAIFFSGHKIHAPQGVGFIYLKAKVKLKAQILGGAQEFSMRGGTENMLGIIGLSKAISLLALEGESYIQKMGELRDTLEKGLLKLPGVFLNGTGPRVCSTVNLAFKGVDGESLLIGLDQAGIAVSLGSACSSGAIEPSRVLLKMGYSLDRARSSLRFSLSRMNTIGEVERTIKVLQSLIKR